MSAQLLHNMSAAPRTQVTCVQRPVHGPQVFFSLYGFLNAAGERLPVAVKRRLRRVGLRGLRESELRAGLLYADPTARLDVDDDEPPPLDGVLVGWQQAHSLDAADAIRQMNRIAMEQRIMHCRDLSLTIRVLARCEGQLYLGHRPPRGSLQQLARRATTFDDPRLARLPSLAPAVWSWPYDARDVALQHKREARRAAARRRREAERRRQAAATPRGRPGANGAAPKRAGRSAS